MMGPKKGTQAWKRQTKSTFYGINMHTLAVESVHLTNGGELVRAGSGGPTHSTRGRQPRKEVAIIYNLTDIVEVPAHLDSASDSSVTRLHEKAAEMRANREQRDNAKH